MQWAWSIARLLSPLSSSILCVGFILTNCYTSLVLSCENTRHFEIPAFLPTVFAINDHYFLLFFLTSHYPDFLPTSWKTSFTSFVNSSLSTAAAKSLQSCLTLCDPINGSPPGSPSLGFSWQEHWLRRMSTEILNFVVYIAFILLFA